MTTYKYKHPTQIKTCMNKVTNFVFLYWEKMQKAKRHVLVRGSRVKRKPTNHKLPHKKPLQETWKFYSSKVPWFDLSQEQFSLYCVVLIYSMYCSMGMSWSWFIYGLQRVIKCSWRRKKYQTSKSSSILVTPKFSVRSSETTFGLKKFLACITCTSTTNSMTYFVRPPMN